MPTELIPQAVPQTGLAKGLSLPLSAYMENYPEQLAIQAAMMRLEHDCMARFGFDYSPEPPNTVSPSYDDTNMARRYGITDRELAAEHGYGLGDEKLPAPSFPALSDAEVVVFSGKVAMRPGAADAPATYRGTAVPKGGCQGESLDKLGARIDTSLASRLDHESADRSQQAPEVQKVIRDWSACMAAEGYTVDSPYNAYKLTPLGGGSADEVTVALADIDCKQQVDLVAVWFRTETALQNQLVEQNQLALKDVRDRVSAAVKKAADVVGR
ncbi:hypothetical protein [Streptomyces sp. TLI_171]|uniref:hypothetical protein n=1 Tax=Streptomyces sp. TLI_171 TaxID=1938859 RepID=UPI000C1952BA|nr:hypothetical protein [Streptomyces sp. TLI_171]RKE20277.1 hypothetical protein BX266_3630 [Streptomyces sp. TLI_171]